MKLTPRLTILFLLLAIVPMVIVGYLAYENGRRTIEQQTISHLISTNILREAELERWVHGNEQSIEELAQRPLVSEYAAVLVSCDTSDPAYGQAQKSTIEDHLKPRLQYGGFFELFIICPRDGLVLASTNERQEGTYKKSEPYYIGGKTRTYVQDTYYSTTLEQSVMVIGTPVKDRQGNLIAVLAGQVNLVELSKIMEQRSGLSQTEDTYLVNKFNFFITEPRFGKGYSLKKAVHTQGVEAALTGKDGVGFYKDYRDVPVIGAYTWLPSFNVCIITEIDQAEAFAPIIRLGWVVAGSIFAAALAAALLAFLFARTITRPLHLLVKGAEEIGDGNLEYRVGTASKDETGELSRAFDRMTAQLNETMVSRDELAESEERFRLAAASASDLIWDWDMTSGRLDWHGRIDKILGYGQAEFPRTRDAWEKAIHPDDIDRVNATRDGHLKKGTPYAEEYRIKRKDGAYLYWTDQGTALRDENGQPYRMIGACSDITERKKAEELRRQLELKAQVTSRLASVGEMAAGVAHEINNPLTAVVGYAQLLMDREDVPPGIRSDLEAINDGARRVAGIIQRLLAFSRQTEPQQKLVDINELIESTLVLRAYHLRVNNIEVVTRLTTDVLETVADPGQIQQVLLNLIVNAEMEMKLAHGKGKITITTEKSHNTIKICCQDDGPGIRPAVMDRIFDPFFTTREVGQGTGLGLSLCYGIVTEHKGKIYVESKPGNGATFIVELPVVTEAVLPKPPKPDVKKSQKAGKVRILVVDDEQVIRDVVNRVLTGEGYKVETVDNAADALKKIESQKYKLILVDIKMPGISGVDFYKRIQKIDKSLARRVVFITGGIMGADTEKFLSETKVAHIDKPFNPEQLSGEVKRALTGGQ
ncbi:MAG: response regulator [Chloroflexi bacterium]|nr:response regulator [Chloroflexota bacterium]